jgi:magnesium-transporting ATPase (P-type)
VLRLLSLPASLSQVTFSASDQVTSCQRMCDLLKYPLTLSSIDRFLLVSDFFTFLFHSLTESTGESLPLPGAVDSTDYNYLETRCIGLQGTHCISGSGMGVVVSTGDATVFGKIAKMTSSPKTGLTTLEREVINFVILICSIMFTMIVLVIIVWYVFLRC